MWTFLSKNEILSTKSITILSGLARIRISRGNKKLQLVSSDVVVFKDGMGLVDAKFNAAAIATPKEASSHF